VSGIGRILVLAGVALVVAGGIAMLLGRMNVPLGRLPGDLSWRGRGWSISSPIVTCLVVSVVLSVLMWVVNSLRR
jgi:hypothetical protein